MEKCFRYGNVPAIFRKYRRVRASGTACAMIVAREAPASPNGKTQTSRKSRMILDMSPVDTRSIASMGCPSFLTAASSPEVSMGKRPPPMKIAV